MTKEGVLFRGFHFNCGTKSAKDGKVFSKEKSAQNTSYLSKEGTEYRMWVEEADTSADKTLFRLHDGGSADLDGQEEYDVDLTWYLAYAVGRNPKMYLMMDELYEQNRNLFQQDYRKSVVHKNALLFWLGLEGQEAAYKFLVILETLRGSDMETDRLYSDLMKAFRLGFRPYANCMKRLREVGDDELKTILGQEIGSCFLGPAYFSVILLLADDMGLRVNLSRDRECILYILWEMQDCFKEAAYYEAETGALLEKAHYLKDLKKSLGDLRTIQPSLNMDEKYACIYRRINQLSHITGLDLCVAGGMSLSDDDLKKVLYSIEFEGEENTKEFIYASIIVLLSKYIIHCHRMRREH